MPTLTDMAAAQRAHDIATTAQRLRESGALSPAALVDLDAFEQASRDYRAAMIDAQRACQTED